MRASQRPPRPIKAVLAGSVAVVTLDNPPVNTLNFALRSELMDELERLENDLLVSAIVLYGANGSFSVGADLAEFDSGLGLAEPSLHETILSFMDQMTTPVIAAVMGSALGGGLELALGCHYRVFSRGTIVGLPESTFGFIPGAGGTQRLPRAIGLERAINLIISGRGVAAEELANTDLVDLLCEGDPLDRSVQFAQEVSAIRPLPTLRDRDIQHGQLEAYLAFAKRAVRLSKAAPVGAVSVVESIESGAFAGGFDVGVKTEMRLFRELADAVPARAARYLFFANRSAGRLDVAMGARALPIESATVIGAGTMGRGIALALLAADLPVMLIDPDQVALASALEAIRSELDRAEARGRTSTAQARKRHAAISTSSEIGHGAQSDLVIEAVFESLEVKKEVFRVLNQAMKPTAILATNTSTLNIDEIAAVTTRPEQVVGMHFFSPAHVMRLLEVVRADSTSGAVLAAVLKLAKRLNKIAVVARVGDGFIGNRVINEYTRQAAQLLLEGALPSQVDDALESWGIRMGPFRVLDLVGNDIPAQARSARGDSEDEDWGVAEELVRRGWLGQKAGRGWYRYGEGGQRSPDPEVADLIRQRAATHRDRRSISDREIVERCTYALVNEGMRVLADGVAASASDIDVVMVHGYGFPASRGGPFFAADTAGLRNVVRTMRRLSASVPSRPELWDPHPIILQLAKENASISQWRNSYG